MISSPSVLGTFLTIAFACFVAYEIIRISYYGKRSVRMGEETIPVSHTPEKPRKRVLVIGDSTAYGTGARNPEKSLVGRLREDFPDIEIVNEAENAMFLARLHEKLHKISIDHFDLIVIHIGGMDVISLTPVRKASVLMHTILEHIKNNHAGHIAVVSVNNAGVPPLIRFPISLLLDWRSRVFSAMCNEVCRAQSVIHIPLYKPMGVDPLHSEDGALFAEDYMHPNDEGYGIWYKEIHTVLNPHLTS